MSERSLFPILELWPWEWDGQRWFDLSGPRGVLRLPGQRSIFFALWNLFRYHTNDGKRHWGVGIVQVRRRHLIYVGSSGVSVLFIGTSQ